MDKIQLKREPKEKAQSREFPLLCVCPVFFSVIPIRVYPQQIQLAQHFVILPSQLASFNPFPIQKQGDGGHLTEVIFIQHDIVEHTLVVTTKCILQGVSGCWNWWT